MFAPVIVKSINAPVTRFGRIWGAGLVGMLVGALSRGPLADRYGRKTMIFLSPARYAVLSLATANAQTCEQLLVLRLISGIGLGGALPNAASLASECASTRHNRTVG